MLLDRKPLPETDVARLQKKAIQFDSCQSLASGQIGELQISQRRVDVCDLQVLLVVAETGSFRKAAMHLGVRQSAVSRRVRKIEDILGVSLFERRPSGTRLTQAGSRFVMTARDIVREFDVAVATARSAGVAEAGTLRVGLIASLSLGVPRKVTESFFRAHPDVRVHFAEADRSELFTLLSHRMLDLVVAAGEPSSEFGDALLLCREAISLAVASNGPLAARGRVRWSELSGATFVVSSREPGPEIHDYILRRVGDLGRRVRIERHRLDREGIMNLVGLGFGVSLVADHWRGVQYPNVTFIPVGEDGETVPFSITWRPENDNPALRRFLSLARVEAKRNGVLCAPSRTPDPLP
jgi:molybdate transport repressor ModE-like protein